MTEQKYADEQYLAAELFEDGDAEIRCLTRKMVVTRKSHRCAFADVLQRPHDISAGTRVIRETAIAEGEWGSCYSCLPCVDQWFDHLRDIGSIAV